MAQRPRVCVKNEAIEQNAPAAAIRLRLLISIISATAAITANMLNQW
jgi:hypothetical protein